MADKTQDTQLENFNETADRLTAKGYLETMKNAGRPLARATTTGPTATTKTLDKDIAPGSSADDAEAAKLNAKIQADAQMKFSARTTNGKFRTPQSKGK
jgi:hypothetical protein